MKKITTRLQLTKTTVRVLRDADLAAVRGGIAVTRISSEDPAVCFASGNYRPGGAEKL